MCAKIALHMQVQLKAKPLLKESFLDKNDGHHSVSLPTYTYKCSHHRNNFSVPVVWSIQFLCVYLFLFFLKKKKKKLNIAELSAKLWVHIFEIALNIETLEKKVVIDIEN
ncbi:hypothetical protein RFI_37142 [Reticulomyxa filosa]|uniref:Uncharacterized protein n=1 Tax=Reticulomyxa filosa TaxID=46433 RepID=X6LFG5_RETFI|nr:hypothetical protein RFI_37142 [Reticulomyxa filosa]|eukprot:ETO00304.1 hypothetical protein RFI_37142 [Reticulomyxa filosa]